MKIKRATRRRLRDRTEYDLMKQGVRNRATTFIDRRKQADKSACRKSFNSTTV